MELGAFLCQNLIILFLKKCLFFVYMKQSQRGRIVAELFSFTFFSQICATRVQVPG